MPCFWKPDPDIHLVSMPCPQCGHFSFWHQGMFSCLACRMENFMDREGVD